jgi:hypothetical protein
MRRYYMLAKPNAAGAMSVTGPYMAVRVPDATNMTVERGGQLITVTDRIKMPLESQASTRCVITDIASNVAYEVLEARGFATFIECSVSRTQADP